MSNIRANPGLLEPHHLALWAFPSGMEDLGTGSEFRTGLAAEGQEPRIRILLASWEHWTDRKEWAASVNELGLS